MLGESGATPGEFMTNLETTLLNQGLLPGRQLLDDDLGNRVVRSAPTQGDL